MKFSETVLLNTIGTVLSCQPGSTFDKVRRCYGVAMISRLLKIVGLFCKISFLIWGSVVKGTCDFEKPTHPRHPIEGLVLL